MHVMIYVTTGVSSWTDDLYLFTKYCGMTRGSTGFGNECLNSLPGCAGLRDVQDVLQATLQTLEEEKCIDPKV